EIDFSRKEDKVFDTKTFNFHLYPCDPKKMGGISEEVKRKRKEIMNVLINDQDIKIVDDTKIHNMEQLDSDKLYIYISKGKKKPSGGEGSKGSVKDLIKENPKYKDTNGLYRFISVYKNRYYYTINFMRFFLEDEVTVVKDMD